MNGIIQLKDFAMENNKLLISLVEICCFFQTQKGKNRWAHAFLDHVQPMYCEKYFFL